MGSADEGRSMREDRKPESTPAEAEEYVAPALTDLGSFDEITTLSSGSGADLEQFSGGPA